MKKFLILPLLCLSMTVMAACSNDDMPAPETEQPTNPIGSGETRTLVAYFSAQGHTQAVAENSSAREGTRRVYRYDADLLALGLELRDEPVDEGALARAGASGDSDDVGLARPRIYLFHNFFGLWRFCLHKTDKAADGSRVAVESAS